MHCRASAHVQSSRFCQVLLDSAQAPAADNSSLLPSCRYSSDSLCTGGCRRSRSCVLEEGWCRAASWRGPLRILWQGQLLLGQEYMLQGMANSQGHRTRDDCDLMLVAWFYRSYHRSAGVLGASRRWMLQEGARQQNQG
jgi:hypothetical protein